MTMKTSIIRTFMHHISSALFLLWLFSVQANAMAQQQVLVSIENLQVTEADLEMALRSSPFYTQFNSMDEQQQALLRGDILKRLVISRLFKLEAKTSGLDKSPEFIKEIEDFRYGLLYREYMDDLRRQIKVPENVRKEWKAQYKGNYDAYSAAKSNYISTQYRLLHETTLVNLRDKYHVKVYEQRVSKNTEPQTIVFEADGIELLMQDVLAPEQDKTDLTKDQILEKIYQQGELRVVAKAAQEAGIDVSARVNAYQDERLPALLIEQKQQQWTRDEAVLKNYYREHPQLSIIPQRWHLGMIVLKNKEDADAILLKIKKGESLFKLAGQYSIDPYGREQNGDMGWVKEGSGNPVIENAIKDLEEGKPSKIIKTDKGYIIATIIDRRPGGKRKYVSMKDKVRQFVINEKMHNYLQELENKYKITWNLLNSEEQQPREHKANG